MNALALLRGLFPNNIFSTSSEAGCLILRIQFLSFAIRSRKQVQKQSRNVRPKMSCLDSSKTTVDGWFVCDIIQLQKFPLPLRNKLQKWNDNPFKQLNIHVLNTKTTSAITLSRLQKLKKISLDSQPL